MNEIVLASQNPKKVKEMQDILAHCDIKIRPVSDFPEVGVIEETGTTFAENAILKAETVTRLTGLPALADDSGLMVDELGGEPGVYSARYSGEDATDESNNAKLLKELSGVNSDRRGAQFCCVIALSVPGLKTMTFTGKCEGRILESLCGEGGFGYDPLFYVDSLKKTFAEASREEKHNISHRGRALRKFVDTLPTHKNR